jgi:hypothetical protein
MTASVISTAAIARVIATHYALLPGLRVEHRMLE